MTAPQPSSFAASTPSSLDEVPPVEPVPVPPPDPVVPPGADGSRGLWPGCRGLRGLAVPVLEADQSDVADRRVPIREVPLHVVARLLVPSGGGADERVVAVGGRGQVAPVEVDDAAVGDPDHRVFRGVVPGGVEGVYVGASDLGADQPGVHVDHRRVVAGVVELGKHGFGLGVRHRAFDRRADLYVVLPVGRVERQVRRAVALEGAVLDAGVLGPVRGLAAARVGGHEYARAVRGELVVAGDGESGLDLVAAEVVVRGAVGGVVVEPDAEVE
jgi:hypothetical protein